MLVNRGGTTGIAELMRRVTGIPVRVTAGDHEVAVTFIERSQAATDTHIRGFVNYGGFGFTGEMRVPRLTGGIRIVGPYDSTGVSRTASREQLFVCEPEVPARETECARKITATLAERAFRRPLDDADLELLMPYYEAGRNEDGSFDKGIERMVAAVLSSPDFLYRTIAPAASPDAHGAYPLNGLELATRLSFFLWRQSPDVHLLEAAESVELDDAAGLIRHTRRMLADDRGKTTLEDFVGQWLNLDAVSQLQLSADAYPELTSELRDSLRQSLESYVRWALWEQNSLDALLRSDVVFVDAVLADLLEVQAPGEGFEIAHVDNRHGLLTQPGLLASTSHGSVHSPILRGLKVLGSFLCVSISAPPPDVNAAIEAKPEGVALTTRQHVEQTHSTGSTCATCHRLIDGTSTSASPSV
jgi:hypothetical protein